MKAKLVVVWTPDEACNGFFLDYFEGIQGVEFLKEYSGKADYYGQKKSQDICKHYGEVFNHEIYAELRPRKKIQQKIWEFVEKNKVGFRVGIHVRRTDLTNRIQGFLERGIISQDTEFFKYLARNSPSGDFYLATDNRDTQNEYRRRYPSLLVYKNIKKSSRLRKTTLEDAIIDVYILSYCKGIMGTRSSSYSELARSLRFARISEDLSAQSSPQIG